MSNSNNHGLVAYYVLVPPEECGDLPPGHPEWDPDHHCPKYRMVTVEMQKEWIEAEKKANNLFVEDEPVLDPQMKALTMIPTLDLIPPNGWWFDNKQDAKAFVTAVARVSNVSVNVVGRTSGGGRLYRFILKVLECCRVRKEKEEGSRPLSLQERRDRHWRAVIKESPIARDFSPELVSHITLMLVCASRALSDDKKGLNRSTDLSNKIEKLQIWFEENDKAALDEFDALHPYRDPNHPNHRAERKYVGGKAKNTNMNKNKNKGRGKARNQGKGGYQRRRGRNLPAGVSVRAKGRDQNRQPWSQSRSQPRSQPWSQPRSQPRSQPLPHPHPEYQTELAKRSREGRRYYPY